MTDSITASTSDLALEFVAINERLGARGDRPSALARIVTLAVEFVPGCDWAGITAWPVGQSPRSLTVSGDVTAAVDALQYQLSEGPCLHATAEYEAILAPDLSAEARWPTFAARALAETPVRGVLALYLADQPVRCGLNLYSANPGALGADAVAAAALFAAHARVVLMHADSADKAANLDTALSTSRQIGAAVGILMSVHKITDEQAFELLRTSSQRLHRKLRDIAEDVVHTGALPEA